MKEFWTNTFLFLRRIVNDRIGSCRGCQSPLMIAAARHLKRQGCLYVGSFYNLFIHIVIQVLSSIDDIDAILKSRIVQESVNKL